MRQTHDWSFIGCDRPRDAFDYLDSRVAFICYEKGIGKGGTLATVYYDAAWRASGVELGTRRNARLTVDRIADPWGPRTPYAPSGEGASS